MIVDFNRNEIEKITKALKNDSELSSYFVIEELPENDKGTDENRTENMFYINLSSAIVNNIDLIKEYDIDEIVNVTHYQDTLDEEDYESLIGLYTDVSNILGSKFFSKSIYKRIIFVIKYFSVKEFFSKNYYKFLPSYDSMIIQNTEKAKIFLNSLMKEFDRFASIIDDISYITDIDSIPKEYINYLAQLVGYQKELDDSLFDYITFRELIKNIVEIYKIKGTSYSIELFFGFIGFTVEMKELWFDRRFYLLGQNTERNEEADNNTSFYFYLTEIDPQTRVIAETKVRRTDISYTKNLQAFNKINKKGNVSLEALLGFENNYKGETYTYFKTNILEIDATPAEGVSVDATKQVLIQNYINFLIPIFIRNTTNYNLLEPDPDGTYVDTLYLYDTDKTENGIVTDYMVHTYPEIFPSGFFLGTSKKVNSWDFSDTYENNLDRLDLFKRDVLKPFEEAEGGEASNYFYSSTGWSSLILLNKNFSYLKNSPLRNNSQTIDSLAYYDIEEIDINNNRIVIKKKNNFTINSFLTGQEIELFSTTLTNRGVYTVLSASESGDYVYITVEGLSENQASAGGYLSLYYDDWLYENFIHNFMGTDNVTIE